MKAKWRRRPAPVCPVCGDYRPRYYRLSDPRTVRILFVSDGISDGHAWATFYRKPNGSLRRMATPKLPMRQGSQEGLSAQQLAQRDLNRYALARRLADCCRVCGCTENHPCDEGCGWADDSHTLCSLCAELPCC